MCTSDPRRRHQTNLHHRPGQWEGQTRHLLHQLQPAARRPQVHRTSDAISTIIYNFIVFKLKDAFNGPAFFS